MTDEYARPARDQAHTISQGRTAFHRIRQFLPPVYQELRQGCFASDKIDPPDTDGIAEHPENRSRAKAPCGAVYDRSGA